jgi:DNA-dependent RNA polymerase
MDKYKTFSESTDKDSQNRLDVDNYLISNTLHNRLIAAYAGEIVNKEMKLGEGLYLVSFRKLGNKDDTLIYNYTYYPLEFYLSVVVYLILRNHYIKTSGFNDWGYYFVVLDNSFLSLENMNHYISTGKDKYITGINRMWLSEDSVEYFNKLSVYEAKCWLNFTTKLMYINNYDAMSSILKWGFNNQHHDFIKLIYSDNPIVHNLYGDLQQQQPKFSVLNSTLFVVKDLEHLIKSVVDKGFIVNQGPQRWRGQINSMSSFQSLIDMDFRKSLYNHYNHHSNNVTSLGYSKLHRNHFTFSNIHQNMGNVKHYSTKRSFTTNRISSNRQTMFEENYTMISDILEKNYNIGSYSVQKEIEKVLYNQENIFSDMNAVKNKFKFNQESYEFITSKYEELCNLLNIPDELEVNTKIYSGKYIPLVKTIVKTMGSKYIANMLISYFMEILTKETHTMDNSDIETPGIMSIKSFHDFGLKLFKRFIYNSYIKSPNYINNNNYSLSEYVNSIKKEYKDIYEVDGSYAMLGGYFVWNLVIVNMLYQTLDKHPENDKETVNYLRIVQNVRDKLFINKVKIYHIPPKLPMVCEPKNWVYSLDVSNNKLGGYLLNDIYFNDKLIRDRIGYEIPTVLKEDNLVVPMVTGVMKTPYKINVDTLEFIYKYGIKKKIITDGSSDGLRDFIRNPHRKYTKKVARGYRSLVSKIIMEKNILSIADVYSKIEKIYFPVRLDFRLRVYCDTDFFDYQKNDLAKGLISFANPGCIHKTDKEAIKYFKAYGANMYGNGLDKKSLNYRVKWVDDNSDKIINFEYNDIVDNTENKTCFISFCFEYIQFVKFVNSIDDLVFYTYLPIQLDATCNGYQHLALLTKETKLLSKLNLDSSTHDEDPGDFYSYISDMCKEYIDLEIDKLSNLEFKIDKDVNRIDSLNRIKNIKFGRDIYKLIIMRDSYSAGIPKITESILTNEYMTEQGKGKDTYYMYKNYDVKLRREDIMILVGSLKRVIGSTAPKIKNLSKYLNDIVSICSILGMPIPWGLPDGAEITGSYLKEEEKKIPAFTFTKSKYTFKKYLPHQYDVKKQKRAIRPNLIHSLDACVIAELYASLKTDKVDLYTVHDCFAVTANHVQKLINKLKLVYIKLYSSSDYLTTFDAMLKININNTFGDKIYKLNDNYINIPNKVKFKKVKFPDLNEIIKLDKDKLKNVPFPDITAITKLNKDLSVERLKQASYPII